MDEEGRRVCGVEWDGVRAFDIVLNANGFEINDRCGLRLVVRGLAPVVMERLSGVAVVLLFDKVVVVGWDILFSFPPPFSVSDSLSSSNRITSSSVSLDWPIMLGLGGNCRFESDEVRDIVVVVGVSFANNSDG